MAKKEASKKENVKNKRSFGKDFKAELKRVVWPTPKQLVNNTIAVLTIVLITAAIVFVLDFAFEGLNKYGINKVKEVINSNNTTSEDTTSSDEETDEEANEENVEESDTTEENAETTTENAENNAQ